MILNFFLLNSSPSPPNSPLLHQTFPLFLNTFPSSDLDETSYIDSFLDGICDLFHFFISKVSHFPPNLFPLFLNTLTLSDLDETSVTDEKPPTKNPPDNEPPRIIEEIIAKYAVDTNLFRLGTGWLKTNSD